MKLLLSNVEHAVIWVEAYTSMRTYKVLNLVTHRAPFFWIVIQLHFTKKIMKATYFHIEIQYHQEAELISGLWRKQLTYRDVEMKYRGLIFQTEMISYSVCWPNINSMWAGFNN